MYSFMTNIAKQAPSIYQLRRTGLFFAELSLTETLQTDLDLFNQSQGFMRIANLDIRFWMIASLHLNQEQIYKYGDYFSINSVSIPDLYAVITDKSNRNSGSDTVIYNKYHLFTDTPNTLPPYSHLSGSKLYLFEISDGILA